MTQKKLPKLNPHSKKVLDGVIEMIEQMTPEEALAFLMYRTPGIEETDMTGMFSNGHKPEKTVPTECKTSSD